MLLLLLTLLTAASLTLLLEHVSGLLLHMRSLPLILIGLFQVVVHVGSH